jgi:hypothetical protein
MRMWNVDARKMCRQHLLGEHNEIHKMVGNLRKSRRWTESLTAKGFLEPQNAFSRHEELAKEMKRRNMNHKSPLDIRGVKLPYGKVSVRKSIHDLRKRCKKCKV